jgi:hypothetical protein
MSLFPTDDILAKLQQQWKGYADALRQEDKEAFLTMIEKCYAHAAAINAKGEPFPNEALLMSLVFSQYKMINWLVPKIAELSVKLEQLEKKREGEKRA